jgi:hypothetical protein
MLQNFETHFGSSLWSSERLFRQNVGLVSFQPRLSASWLRAFHGQPFVLPLSTVSITVGTADGG